MYEYKATLDRVVDGDTVDIHIDLGFTITTKQRVRLSGLNAPEHNTEAGQKTIAYVKEWFDGHDHEFIVRSRKPGGGDKYGRYLAIILDTKGTSLNGDLCKSGHAVLWDGSGEKPSAD